MRMVLVHLEDRITSADYVHIGLFILIIKRNTCTYKQTGGIAIDATNVPIYATNITETSVYVMRH